MDANRRRIRDELKRLLVQTLELDVPAAEIRDDEPLFEAGLGVDSVEALALVNAVEETFGVQIPDDDIGIGLFQDIRSLAEVVERLSGRAP
jgi:acyl carrier protein